MAETQVTQAALLSQIIGVGAAVLGDMSSRPYWGLYELDFVFSTLIVSTRVLEQHVAHPLAAVRHGIVHQPLIAACICTKSLAAFHKRGCLQTCKSLHHSSPVQSMSRDVPVAAACCRWAALSTLA